MELAPDLVLIGAGQYSSPAWSLGVSASQLLALVLDSGLLPRFTNQAYSQPVEL
ncbi:hypothetical protein [Mesorhizobium sp. M3A.F.Ca.ET.080.04.2.1]|uniref:hypothetical protein n=1 Tax=Mesorhizobium sp. M3A.F.Ca.ET.080.04.2.1 TaxID=2493676 RepID=UPI0013ED3764|nr:hypothetical protein [Mesorhizobium sp. M3A.F.Ca.ET.080.04.2.1]